jgi:hypothetical protein
MHVVTYKAEGVGPGEYRFSFATLSAVVNFIMKLREKNVPFTHVFEE